MRGETAVYGRGEKSSSTRYWGKGTETEEGKGVEEGRAVIYSRRRIGGAGVWGAPQSGVSRREFHIGPFMCGGWLPPSMALHVALHAGTCPLSPTPPKAAERYHDRRRATRSNHGEKPPSQGGQDVTHAARMRPDPEARSPGSLLERLLGPASGASITQPIRGGLNIRRPHSGCYFHQWGPPSRFVICEGSSLPRCFACKCQRE